MATIDQQTLTPPITPAPSAPPVQPTVPISTSVNPADVYSPTNIQQIDVPGTKSAMSMKLDKLEKKLANATKIEELNQISIMNQPKAMGVLTGEAAYRSRLDTARLNAFNSLYQNRLAEEERKAAERKTFMDTYGADPSKRPKGMSKNEFAKALGAGQFGNLLTEDFRQKQLDTKLKQAEIALKKQDLAGGGGTVSQQQGKMMVSAEQALNSSRGEDGFVDPGVYTQQRQAFVSKGGKYSDFDSQFGNMLSQVERANLNVGGGLNDNAVDIAAQTYLTTGQMPSLGMGSANTRSAILNRAGELANEQGLSVQDILQGRAQYKASSGSLNNLQKYTDQVLSFEQTASSNLDLAQSLSDRVDRSGSPLMNKYELYTQGQLSGDPDTLAFMAAVQTATNEYAKVVTGQTGGAAVSDSARKETEQMLNAAYDPEAFKRVVATMKQEMANRRQGLTGQLQQIQGNLFIGGSPQTESQLSDEQAYQIYLNMINKQ